MDELDRYFGWLIDSSEIVGGMQGSFQEAQSLLDTVRMLRQLDRHCRMHVKLFRPQFLALTG